LKSAVWDSDEAGGPIPHPLVGGSGWQYQSAIWNSDESRRTNPLSAGWRIGKAVVNSPQGLKICRTDVRIIFPAGDKD